MFNLKPSRTEKSIPIPIGYQEAIETPKASRSTEALWSFHAEYPGESIVLPDGRCDLILRAFRAEPDRFIPVVTGPATSAYAVHFDEGDTWYGVRLRPDRAKAVWGAQLRSARNQVARGAAAEGMMPALGERMTDHDPVDRLKRSIPEAGFAEGSPTLGHALDVIHYSGGRIRVDRLADVVKCSARHLNRLFCDNVGLGCKTYIQLAQFHRTLRLIRSGGMTLTQAAFEGGYADQAHMTRAFRRFGGFAPTSIPENLTLPAVFLS